MLFLQYKEDLLKRKGVFNTIKRETAEGGSRCAGQPTDEKSHKDTMRSGTEVVI